MKSWTWPIIILLTLLAAFAPAEAQEPARRFIAAMEAYKAQQYQKAIANLEAIAQEGVRNGALYYNLGNAYLKSNDLGRAILWYERALSLLPNDPDLRFNHTYALSLARDAAEENADSLVRILFFWKFQLGSRTVVLWAICLNLIFWGLLLVWRLTRRRAFRHAAAAALVPALIFILTAVFNYYEVAQGSDAVVLAEQVPVRSGLTGASTELFVLHAGARVKVVKHIKDHLQIRFSKDKIGWVEQHAVGVI